MKRDSRSASDTGIVALLVVSALFLSTPACAPQPLSVTREPTTLPLVAAGSCATRVEDAAQAYEAAHPWVTVTFEVLNNALAAEALAEGNADLALLSWGLVGDGNSLWLEPFARDGVAVIVHPASPFAEIELAQLREIFRGHLQEWDGVIVTVVSREEGSGTRAAFESIVLDGEGTTLNAVLMPSGEAMVDYVASTPEAIGYVSTRCLDDRVRALPIEGVLPTEQTIATGSYPLWRELQLASSGEPTGEARQFAQWFLRGNVDYSRSAVYSRGGTIDLAGRVDPTPWVRAEEPGLATKGSWVKAQYFVFGFILGGADREGRRRAIEFKEDRSRR